MSEIARGSTVHRPGVLLLSADEVGLANLDSGSVRPVSIETIFTADHPELRVIPDAPLPEPVVSSRLAEYPEAEMQMSDETAFVLGGPVALRLDNHRVLAWSSASGSHVELDAVALRLLDLLRLRRQVHELRALANGSCIEPTLRWLIGLNLIREDEPVPAPATAVLADEGHQYATSTPEQPPARPVVEISVVVPDQAPSSTAEVQVQLTKRGTGQANLISKLRDRFHSGGSRHGQAGHEPDQGPSELTATAADRAVPTDDRVPVIPLYYFGKIVQTDGLIEPSLAIGMLMAYARAFEGGRLNDRYDFHRMQADPEVAFERWAESPVPAVFLFPDYIWSVERNLALSKRIKDLSPDSVCIHGGPSSPKYHADTMQFFEDNPFVDAAARGEGEETFAAVLDALNGDLSPSGIDQLDGVTGITFRRRTGDREVVRNPDRPRPVEMEQFPSPYLTGEFDDLLEYSWRWATLETNRGCPYGCTFCDWGSATSARVRKFDLDQVKQEIDWILANVSTSMILVADANFGIFARDVEIVQHVVDAKRDNPQLTNLVFTGLAKNTVKYTKEIYRLLYDARLTIISSPLSIQSADEEVLAAIDRQNIRLERYDELAETFREMGIPMMTDLIIGLPGSSIRSFKHDLQFCFDREITPRVFPLLMLPNSPMNDPEYKKKYQIVWNEKGQIVSTSTFNEADLRRMEWIRLIFRGGDHYGVLRHLMQYLQWDHGILASEFVDAIDLAIQNRQNRYPLLAFFGRLFDLYTMPPVAWEPFYDEVYQLIEERFGVPVDSGLRSMITLQMALLPERGRTFPLEIELEHDFVSYRADHLDGNGQRKLVAYGPASIRVSDPGGVSPTRIQKNEMLGDRQLEFQNVFWNGLDWEMDSPLARRMFSNDYLFASREKPEPEFA